MLIFPGSLAAPCRWCHSLTTSACSTPCSLTRSAINLPHNQHHHHHHHHHHQHILAPQPGHHHLRRHHHHDHQLHITTLLLHFLHHHHHILISDMMKKIISTLKQNPFYSNFLLPMPTLHVPRWDPSPYWKHILCLQTCSDHIFKKSAHRFFAKNGSFHNVFNTTRGWWEEGDR